MKEEKDNNAKIKSDESENEYLLLFKNMTQGFSLHEVITDSEGKPIDYRFIDVNPAFERLTGLKAGDIVGKTVKEVLPKIEKYWIETYGNVAITGEPKRLVNYSQELNRYYDTWCYSPKKGQFAVAFSDITENKLLEDKLKFSYIHDDFTRLYNRRYINEKIRELNLDTSKLPISVIIGDINGMKIYNDAFGMAEGDNLIMMAKEHIVKHCRESHIIGKWGGDEFIVILPNTNLKEAEDITGRIKESCKNEKKARTELSVSFGVTSKNKASEDIDTIIKNAEVTMLRNKTYESIGFRGQMIYMILNTLYAKNKREEEHSRRVSEICVSIGRALKLGNDELNKLKAIGLLHDIGKIGIDERILNKKGKLTKTEWLAMRKHVEIGYRILSSTTETAELVPHILSHHEHLDGSGYPYGLREKKISLYTRILSIADAFDAMTSERTYRRKMKKEEAVKVLLKHSGTQFDKDIVKVLMKV